MTLYRFTHKRYSTDISGEGARLKGGRWNGKGFPVVYTSSTISLSLLELVIHSASYDELQSNLLIQIKIPDSIIPSLGDLALKTGWRHDTDYSRFIGNEFIKGKQSLLLKVPSAIIPEESNFLINPLHPDIKKIKNITASPFQFDIRLFK
ncbi:MAG: RES family NAD+ phosphorylase [Bacteroidota bacterium]